ncbi:MAG: aspartate aminotransferase family protein [Candidatus Hydrogenedentes bacterium]|nr:aspartate aminotransferase family protein [Candidatus Hydrogenedentota bacterium]
MNAATRPEELLTLKAAYLMPCVYHFYRQPPVIVSGEGAFLADSTGKRYLDCYSGVTVMSAGHGNTEILDVAITQLRRLQHTTTIYLTEPMLRLAERLAAIAPGAIRRTFFCASGSEANETAMLLASLATGRHGIIALTDALHGRTNWAMSVTGLDMWRTSSHLLEDVRFAPHPFCASCPLRASLPSCEYACIARMETLIEEMGPENVAAVVAEPIQGNGGIIVPPEGYWQRVRRLCDRYGILLIFDEVQTAMNRTGRWFGSEHWDTIPDIVTMAKALGNGLPIAAVMATDAIAQAYTRPGAATFGANPVSCAAALATLEFHERERLGERALRLGAEFREGLEQLARAWPCLTRVRGKGMMTGVDVVAGGGEADGARCDAVLELLKDLGFLAGKTGRDRNTLTFMPPLVVEAADLQRLLDAVNRAVRETKK